MLAFHFMVQTGEHNKHEKLKNVKNPYEPYDKKPLISDHRKQKQN